MDAQAEQATGSQGCQQLTAGEYLAQFLSPHEVVLIIDQLGAVSLEDLRLVDKDMAEEATKGMKLIPRKKAITALLNVSAANSTTADFAPENPAPENPAPENPATDTKNVLVSEITDSNAIPEPKKVEECVAIAIDRSGSMGTGFDEQKAWCDDGNAEALKKTLKQRSRMDAVKQVFYAFRDRTESLGKGRHEIGLIQFDNEIEVMLGLTSSLGLFEEIVDNITHRGPTAIYSAILESCKMLRPVFEKSPRTDLRILVLTDGQNNSGLDPHTALAEVNKIGAVVDAIIVGDTPDENLRRIVTATEGSCFQINSLSEGFELMESEAVVSLRARRGGVDKAVFVERMLPAEGFDSIEVKVLTGGRNTAAIIKNKAPTAKRVAECGSVVSGNAPQVNKSHTGALKRIMKEITDVSKGGSSVWLHSGEGCYIFPDSDDIFLMKALITGPKGTPFVDGTFVLNIKCPTMYPFKPPTITFETSVYHCNVSDAGAVCLDILQHAWSPALSIPKVVESVRLLLANPDTDNALRQWIAELTIMHHKSGGADTRYFEAAKTATTTCASKTVDEWKTEWGL